MISVISEDRVPLISGCISSIPRLIKKQKNKINIKYHFFICPHSFSLSPKISIFNCAAILFLLYYFITIISTLNPYCNKIVISRKNNCREKSFCPAFFLSAHPLTLILHLYLLSLNQRKFYQLISFQIFFLHIYRCNLAIFISSIIINALVCIAA